MAGRFTIIRVSRDAVTYAGDVIPTWLQMSHE
jgi:hypothetical protein